MTQQIQFLLERIEQLTNRFDIMIRYEFNSDIEIHFVQILSKTLSSDFIEKISDEMYNDFVEAFPNELVAVLNENSKYKFRFTSEFDNTESVECFNLLNENNIKAVNISNFLTEVSINYNRKSTYKESLKTKKLSSIDSLQNYNEEFALAA